MTTQGIAMFETAVGECGIAWSERGVTGFQLPEGDESSTRRRMALRFSGTLETAPPADVQRSIDAIIALMRGENVDLSFVPLDMEGVPDFHQRVYDVARTIRPGVTLTYGEIARRLGDPGSARAVGQALGRNPFAVIVPCHRVLAAGGKTGGFSATGGAATKLTLLAIEGAQLF
jgi:methylated-DNA-[protein]-cysteine S-methyltransferase